MLAIAYMLTNGMMTCIVTVSTHDVIR